MYNTVIYLGIKAAGNRTQLGHYSGFPDTICIQKHSEHFLTYIFCMFICETEHGVIVFMHNAAPVCVKTRMTANLTPALAVF